jgi:enoyl-CoA hydratase
MSEEVLLERHGEIAWLTLNRPAKLNAVNDAMWERLADIFAGLDGDESLRCVVIAGAGERAFSVGADIAEFERNRSSAERARAYFARVHRAMAALTGCRHPVVAAIHGLCVGGGLELATICDLRLCGEGSRFGVPIKRLGLTVSYAEMAPLIELVGPANALEILLEGEIFDASRAYDMGLVNRVVADQEVEAEARSMAARIAEGAPLVARWHKKFARRLLERRPLAPAEFDESFACFDTEDFQTGYRAFLAKQRPVFRGR